VSQSLLHRPQIDACPEAASREGRPELVQPEVVLVELRAHGAGLQPIQEIKLRVASGSREEQIAFLVGLSSNTS
jgi:hypothetical protein